MKLCGSTDDSFMMRIAGSFRLNTSIPFYGF
jgi:hypothetical protein